MLSEAGTGNAKHDRYLCPSAITVSPEAGLVAERPAHRVLPFVWPVGWSSRRLLRRAESAVLRGFSPGRHARGLPGYTP